MKRYVFFLGLIFLASPLFAGGDYGSGYFGSRGSTVPTNLGFGNQASSTQVLLGYTTIYPIASGAIPANVYWTSTGTYTGLATAVAKWGIVYGSNTVTNNVRFVIYDSTGGLQCMSPETSVGTTLNWWTFDLSACNSAGGVAGFTIQQGTGYFIGSISAGSFVFYGDTTGSGSQKAINGTEVNPGNPAVNNGTTMPSGAHSVNVTN